MAKLTDPNLRYERQQQSKTIREMEYGVIYPDGTIEWKSNNFSTESLEYAENREQLRKSWEEKVERAHIGAVAPLVFVSRIRKISFSEITPLA